MLSVSSWDFTKKKINFEIIYASRIVVPIVFFYVFVFLVLFFARVCNEYEFKFAFQISMVFQ
jgi:hypothetical protein